MLPCNMFAMIENPSSEYFRPLSRAGIGLRGSVLLLVLLCSAFSFPQALSVRKLPNGTELILITRPLAELDAACRPGAAPADTAHCVAAPELLFASVLETDLQEDPPPACVLILAGVGQRGILDRLEDLLSGKEQLAPQRSLPQPPDAEGGIERRLTAPGSPSKIRLEIPLPEAADPRRPAMETLWAMLPHLLKKEFPGIRAGHRGSTAFLELEVDGETAETRLSALRLALARLAADPSLKADDILATAHRLQVARMAGLEEPEKAGKEILGLWREGGVDAVRQYLFGLKSVDPPLIVESIRSWLTLHPGRALISLPPRIFQPRFAPGPKVETLENNLSAAVLERPQVSLSALVLRPILLSGLGGDAEALVLTRIGAAIRAGGLPLPSLAVRDNPPRLELVADADGFALLCEALQRALAEVAEDEHPVAGSLEPRDRALSLLGQLLGLNTGREPSAADILAPGNLALGGLAPDAETAMEALRKFGVGGEKRQDQLLSSRLDTAPRHRQAAAGSRSAVAVGVEYSAPWPLPGFLRVLLRARAEETWPEAKVRLLQPLVPGKQELVLLIEAEAPGRSLEDSVRENFSALFLPVDEEQMSALRRRVVLEETQKASGIIGRARSCAAVAAGETGWRAPDRQQMQIMSLEVTDLNDLLGELEAGAKTEWATVGPMELEKSPEKTGPSGRRQRK